MAEVKMKLFELENGRQVRVHPSDAEEWKEKHPGVKARGTAANKARYTSRNKALRPSGGGTSRVAQDPEGEDTPEDSGDDKK